MENFILWNLNSDRGSKRIRFYATSLGLQQINRGSREMLDEMTRDFGFETLAIDDWAVRHMATDYFSDERESDDWRDRWMYTWEVEVHARDAVKLPTSKGEVPTLAHDKTYGGEEQMPAEALVVADFKHEKALRQLVDTVGTLAAPQALETRIGNAAPDLSRTMIRRLSEELAQHRDSQRHMDVVSEISPSREHQVFVHIPANRAFFQGGAGLAIAIEELVEQLGGSTHWRSSVLAEDD